MFFGGLPVVPAVHGQVIEEGGFPVKGESFSGEPFSLSCPSRLVAEAGGSVPVLCTATSVPEEGVRYEWESASGDGLRFLSDAQILSPLFTTPVSGADPEYAYRLMATGPGVYATASVTIAVQGVSGQSAGAAATGEECDPFMLPEGLGEGCLEDTGPVPFGFGPEEEFLFPDGAGLPDHPSGPVREGGFESRTPPRLECPAAVFLEELETGAIECHAWDASGEEYLEYSWQPVGSTTRDYLDNPRLFPEDSPTPSVIAPETPAHETLESLQTGETTLRYRYRLTATSRATGLSSFSEVEVFVSSSRPGVYCPLEVLVEEGETVSLDCEGADPLSFRMDYDEEAASVLWEWEGLWGTDTAPLAATDLPSPLFTAPLGSAGKEYHYIASMTSSASGAPRVARRRVTVRVASEEAAEQAQASKANAPSVTCEDAEVYEATDDFELDCSAEDAPEGATYSWVAQGDTDISLLVGTADSLARTFSVPSDIPGRSSLDRDADINRRYRYTVTMSSGGSDIASANITVTVWEKPNLHCRGWSTNTIGLAVDRYAGEPDYRLDLCEWYGAPAGSKYEYKWIAQAETPNTDRLDDDTVMMPLFDMPEPHEIDGKTRYKYQVTASAENADGRRLFYHIAVSPPKINVTCPGNPYEVDEGDEIELECIASGWPGDDPEYTWSWSPENNLTSYDTATPTFEAPDDVDRDTTYTYRVRASARHATSGAATVTVTVKDRIPLLACEDSEAYEGAGEITLDCSVKNEPSDASYSWEGRDGTQDTSRLTGTDTLTPTFAVPDNVSRDETYKYAVTLSAADIDDISEDVTVTVRNKPAIAVTCPGNPYRVYEGEGNIVLDCTASNAPDGSSYAFLWEVRGDTEDTDRLSGTTVRNPTFDIPDAVDDNETHEYRVTATAENAEDGFSDVTVSVLKKTTLALTCEAPDPVYEGSPHFDLDCTASGAPEDSPYEYEWTGRNGTRVPGRLSSATVEDPTFNVPRDIAADTDYEYTLTASARGAEDASADVTVTVKNKPEITVSCPGNPYEAYEGTGDITLDCTAADAPEGSLYEYEWTARGSTTNTDNLIAGADGPAPTFEVPDEVASDKTYRYRLTVTAENAVDGVANVTVRVRNKPDILVSCRGNPYEAYEGADNITLDCMATGAPSGSAYDYAWTPRGGTVDTDKLSSTTIGNPTFEVPDEVDSDETYGYTLTARAENAETGTANVTVRILNRKPLDVACVMPAPVYEGAPDFALDCEASGELPGSTIAYAWEARGDTQDTSLLSATDIEDPTFDVPEAVDAEKTYEYLLTVSAENAIDAAAEVTVRVLKIGSIAVICASPPLVYEGSEDVALDCSISGNTGDADYTYAWTTRGDTQDTSLLSATDISSPTFHVPSSVAATTTYEYLLTAGAEGVRDATADVAVTVLNKGSLAVACADPGSVYEGSSDIAFDCEASGAPAGSSYNYAWTAQGSTQGTSLLSATDVASPTFHVPEDVAETTTYEYLLTASAKNADEGSAEVTVTVLDRVETPEPEPVTPPVASSAREPSEPSSLGVTVSASALRFGVQSADTEVSLDPVTDLLSTYVSGPHHAGRMTLSAGGATLDENGEMDLSIELLSPVALRRADGVEADTLVLAPSWSFAESCEQLSSQTLGGLYTEATLTEEACLLLRFGGELDLSGVSSGRYAGAMDIVLRSGENEETYAVEVDVTVVPAQRVITIGPGGVRFDTSREIPAGLTEKQNLSIYPEMAFLTERQPDGSFELSNPSLIPLEVSVSARFGYTEATEVGREVVVENIENSDLGDLSAMVDIHPGVLILQPGEKGLIRYGVSSEALSTMEEKGYAAFFDMVSEPRQYVRSDQMPEEVSGDRTARVTMRVPGVYVPGEGASQLSATLLSVSYVGSPSATFLLETGDGPFVGEVVAYDGEGRELGRRETLVYTRSRVRIPLDRMPEEETVFLRFLPRGSDRAPAPASVEWNVPGRDIGAAGGKVRPRPPARLGHHRDVPVRMHANGELMR